MVRNVHERHLPVPATAAGDLVDSLAGPRDLLWPHDRWPAMRFDRPLEVGAVGGHGPIRYTVEEYVPGQRVRFRFHGPTGLRGYHEFEVLPRGERACLLRHSLIARMGWPTSLTWPLVFRWLHDALVEDAFDTATRNLGLDLPVPARWSPYVRALRSLGRRRPVHVG